jgi:hypothetical protein
MDGQPACLQLWPTAIRRDRLACSWPRAGIWQARAFEDGHQERAGSPAQVEKPPMLAELVALGQRAGRARAHGLDPGGVDPLGLRVQPGDVAGGPGPPGWPR